MVRNESEQRAVLWRGLLSTTLWRTLRRDAIARLALLLLALISGLRVLELGDPEGILARLPGRASTLLFSLLVLVALRHGLHRIAAAGERRFWNQLMAAFLCWTLAELAVSSWPTSAPTTRLLVIETLLACFYTLFILAIERRPHQQTESRMPGLERHLIWPGVTVFVLGLLLYFVLIPAITDPTGQATSAVAGLFYVPLDIYLVVRLLYLARDSRSPRWHVIFFMLALAATALLGSGLLHAAVMLYGSSLSSVLVDGLLDVFAALVILAVRCRHRSFAPLGAAEAMASHHEALFEGLSAQTLSFALLFPLIHFAAARFGLFGAAGATAREVLVSFWIVLLGAIALLQHRFLESLARTFWVGQRRLEEQLHGSEGDLRLMIERRRTDVSLRESRVRFTKVFRACSSAMAVSTLPEGRFVEVNRGFERLTGYREEDILGHTFEELALFDDEANAAVDAVLQGRDTVSEVEAVLVRRDGEQGDVLVSREVIDMDGTPCLLSVLHDVTARRQAEARAQVRAELLADAADVVYAVDGDGRFTYWNPQAEKVYGWTAAEILGRHEGNLLYRELGSQCTARDEVLAAGQDWVGTLTQVAKGGETLSLAAWWIATTGEAGLPSGRLVVGTATPVRALV